MDFFKRYNSIGGSHQQSAADTIQRLADRVATSTLLEDKRAAVLGLKGLSREYRQEVGDASLAALLKVVNEDSEDQNLLKAVLETLTNLCAREPAHGESNEVGGGAAAVATGFSQAILDDSDDIISTLLELLGDADFYVRYYTVQLLGTLHVHFGDELQRRTLVSPMGVGRLVDLLTDQRDIIRNEGIQLLIAMTESNADIQKIVAFENAFDHLLGIVDEEGGVRGNIVVQDCLQLLHNLLNYNVSNQNFFREASGIQRLPNLLITDPNLTAAGRNGAPPADSDDLEWTAQHARNMLVVLDIIRMLIQHGNTNTESNQTAMQQCGLIPPLLQLALAPDAPSSVRSQALYAIGDIIRMHQANQNLFQRILITAAPDDDDDDGDDAKAIPEPAIVIVIRLSVGKRPAVVPANEYYIVRAAAAYLVQAYSGGNPDAQLALAATLIPPGDDGLAGTPDEHQSAGSLIVSVLLGWQEAGSEDVWRVWYAALLLSTILNNHTECKQQALKLTVGDESKGEVPLPLLNELMSQARHAIQGGAETRLAISLLTLVCVWLVNFPPGVSAFLDESSNVAFLVEQINGSSGISALVQGVAAFLFGLVYQFDTETDTPMTRESLYPILSKRVGADQLLIRVQRLRDSREFQYAVGLSAGTHSSAYGGIPVDVYFDGVFTDLFKRHYEGFRAAVRLGPSEALANPSYAHLQGGMAGYPASAASASAPGTPALAAVPSLSRAASPALAAQTFALGVDSEPTVPKREFDAQAARVAEQACQIEALQRELAEARSVTTAADEQLAQEKAQRSQLEAERDVQENEISRLRSVIDSFQEQPHGADGSSTLVAELEKQVADLQIDAEKRSADWSTQRDELQRKLVNAEKQVVKAAAAGRNTNKKKDQQQTVALESMRVDLAARDEQIATLSQTVAELTEQAKAAAGIDELKDRIAGLEKEQEDLLVYLADQDQQAKEYRARLRKHGEDIPLSDDDGDE